MKKPSLSNLLAVATFASGMMPAFSSHAADAVLLGWNNLGMHCMDSDYSVFSILPPYNSIEAQLIVGGKLVTNGAAYTVTYQAMADPAGSFNSTSAGKGNFYSFVAPLYGAALAPDQGLAGWNMPGLNNTPQALRFETANQPAPGVLTPVNWFRAEGIPLAPFDDTMRKNTYPMMLLVARDAGGAMLDTSPIVLPVSDEMDCRACHASGSGAAAQPAGGWVNDANPERDYRLNILRLHDERQFAQHATTYAAALATNGFSPAGLYTNVTALGKPVLCATCHSSAALGTAGFPGVPQLTTSVHAGHASVLDPTLNTTLDSANNRAACYRCHPGSTTKCLRGAMGAALAADGSMLMQCQSCHGNMSQVGAANRLGWLMEPNCQGCHTGTALNNSGQIRFTSVFTDANGTVRQPADSTFATTPNTPAAGLSLYRFSSGHGGLQCEACHGSTHAEFPTIHTNDNVRNLQLQGHVGVTVECTVCHAIVPDTVAGGPHGMHPIGQSWVSRHGNLFEGGGATQGQCRACHGLDYRGTVLSRAQADRTLVGESESGGTVQFFRGELVGCYTCHSGPGGSTDNTRPTVKIISPTTSPTFSAGSATLSLGGTASDNAGIANVAWKNDRGGSGLAIGTASWTVPNLPLQPGVNVVTVTAQDTSGNAGQDTLTVTYSTGGSLTVLINGNGTVSPDLSGRALHVGSRFTLTARPAAGALFANWTGNLLASTPAITFVLQSNMVLQANFVPNPFPALKGAYSGLFADANGVTHQGAGSFSLVLTPAGAYSGSLQAGGARFGLSGRFDAAGRAHANLVRSAMAPLAVELQLDLTNGTEQITGAVSGGAWNSVLSGGRASAQAQAGVYTMVIPGNYASAAEPAGDGFGVVAVDSTGRTRVTASLADGTRLTQSATVSRDGRAPLYGALYGGQGHVWSWLTLTNGGSGGLYGPLNWLKPNSPAAKYYPGGFTVDTTAWGSRYQPPPQGNTVLGVADATLVLTGGDLSGTIADFVSFGPGSKVASTNKLALSFTLSTGAFQGKAFDAGANRWVPFYGVAVQDQHAGHGYFLGTSRCGPVYLGH